ncbi:thrombospondin type-1 domain-containing protein [Aeromonas sp. 23P]|uniref:thrombospondin type-1 domain-containing protein n=1 Tax=Aeromonas sp. 23P TaxID=3452716 RepID=UPI003F7A577E
MKKNIFFLIPLALFSASAFSNIASRETANQIVMKSDKATVTANLIYTGQSSQLSVGLGSKPITDFRGGAPKSRLSGCAVSPTSVFTTETAAKAAVSACFSESIYNQIEADMAYLMKNQNAQTAIYTFTQPVTIQFKVRNASGTTTVKESMFVSTTMLMRAGDAIGGSTRMGFLMSARATNQYLYVKYEQGKNFDMFDANMKMADAGKALIYTIADPNNINANRLPYGQLGTINKYDEPMEPSDAMVEDPNGYDQDAGIKLLLTDLKPVMEETGSAAAIIDYGRRIEPKYNQDSSGTLTPELFEIRVKDRSYYRNECTAVGVQLSQVAQMNIRADYRRDRIIVSNINQLATPIRMGNLAVQENISTASDPEAVKFIGKTITVNQAETFTGYPYTDPFITYKNKVMDPIGTNSRSPDNLFTEWTNDPYNKLPASIYKEIAPMRDDTVCKIEFLETYEVAPGYWKQEPQYGTITNCAALPTGGQKCNSYSGIVGYQSVWEPAIYGKRLASSCVHNAQVDAYCQGRECVTTCGTTAKGGQYYWLMSAWGGCSNGCGKGVQTRTVVCKNKTGATVSDVYCSSAGSKPATSQSCQGVTSCGYSWAVGEWSACNAGYSSREVYCRRSDGTISSDSYCSVKPDTVKKCDEGIHLKVILGCYFYGNGETVEAKRCAIMDAKGDGVEINTQQGSYRVHASITSVKSFITFSQNTHTDTVVGVVPSSVTGTPILGMTISINNSPYIPISLTKTPSSNESASTLAHTVQNEPAADIFKMFQYMYQHPYVEYDDRFEKVVDLYIKNIVVN